MKHLMIWLIGLYRKFISPLKRPCCRYTPTCSAYAIEAFRKRGFIIGFILSTWRVLRCNPFSKGGYDPVPEKGLRRVKNARPPEWIDCEQGCDSVPNESEEAVLPENNEPSITDDAVSITADSADATASADSILINAQTIGAEPNEDPADSEITAECEDKPKV